MTAPFPSQPRCSSPRFDREKPVAGYIRISGADGQTLEGQEAALREYCGSRGWKVQVYRDERSGADVSRPGLEAMLQAVRRGEVRAVVCVKLDRLGRSLVHLVMIVEELTRLRGQEGVMPYLSPCRLSRRGQDGWRWRASSGWNTLGRSTT